MIEADPRDHADTEEGALVELVAIEAEDSVFNVRPASLSTITVFSISSVLTASVAQPPPTAAVVVEAHVEVLVSVTTTVEAASTAPLAAVVLPVPLGLVDWK